MSSRRRGRVQVKLSDKPSWSEVEKIVLAVKKWSKTNPTRHKLRAYLFMALLAKTGVRISELLAVTKDCINKDDATLTIRQLKRKHETHRQAILPPSIMPDLREYIAPLGDKERLFPLTSRAGLNIVHKWTLKVLGRRIRAHAFRHTYAIRILEVSKDIDLARQVLGHEGYDVLKVYLDYSPVDKKDLVLKAIE